MPERDNQAKDGSSRFRPRYNLQKEIFRLSGTPSQNIGASKAVRGVKGRVYIEDKGGACVEGGHSLEPWRQPFARVLDVVDIISWLQSDDQSRLQFLAASDLIAALVSKSQQMSSTSCCKCSERISEL